MFDINTMNAANMLTANARNETEKANQAVREWRARAQELEAKVKELDDLLLEMSQLMGRDRAVIAGLYAQLSAAMPYLEGTELLQKTGKAYPNGQLQTQMGILFDETFLKEAEVQEVEDPKGRLREVRSA